MCKRENTDRRKKEWIVRKRNDGWKRAKGTRRKKEPGGGGGALIIIYDRLRTRVKKKALIGCFSDIRCGRRFS